METAPKPITHRRVLKIAVPIVLSNATVPILGAVDTGVVGQLGEAAPIGAVGLGAIILSSLYWIFGFLRMGTTGLVGQAAGAGDRAEVSAFLTRALLIAGLAGLALIVLQPLLFAAAFATAPASEDVEAMARTYLTIRIWTAPAAIAVFALTGWLIAMERTGAVFWVQLAMNGVNIALDLLFVLGLGWGVAGVAVATVIAELTGVALALWYCRDAFDVPSWGDPSRVFHRATLMRMAVVNTDIFIRSALIVSMFTSFTLLMSGQGDVTFAAGQVLIHFIYIASYALDGFAFAAEALVARSVGRGDLGRVRRSTALTGLWSGVAALGFTLSFWAFGAPAIDLMTRAPEVRSEARLYLPWLIAAPLLSFGAYWLDGVFIGATRTADMRNMMAVSFAIYVVAVLAFLPLFGAHGLWAALLVSFIARGATLALRYAALERAVVS